MLRSAVDSPSKTLLHPLLQYRAFVVYHPTRLCCLFTLLRVKMREFLYVAKEAKGSNTDGSRLRMRGYGQSKRPTDTYGVDAVFRFIDSWTLEYFIASCASQGSPR